MQLIGRLRHRLRLPKFMRCKEWLDVFKLRGLFTNFLAVVSAHLFRHIQQYILKLTLGIVEALLEPFGILCGDLKLFHVYVK